MPDIEHYANRLEVADPLREPVIRAAIRTLHLPPGSRGLDAGCGIGLQIPLLAKAVGPTGHVTGLDISPAFLDRARKLVAQVDLSERVSFREGNIHQLPFDDDTFDWLWSADCAGYPTRSPLPLMRELVRVVRPGGTVAILVWSSQMLLPGHPLLEARLNATGAGIAPFSRDMEPEQHFLRALGWFRGVGLEGCTVRTLVGDLQGPLTGEMRTALVDLFEMRWTGAQTELSSEDWAEYQRLCQSQSPDCILDRPGYYAFFTESLFCGQVVK
ncbi:MAG: class I SAM-dependent methyltransferase [Anaerolineae bacterium]|jgi:demethylmenaquinone methyltransferase/2-methoxy-6-polyprenyl-1,4-benzoquinol methylase